MPVRHKSVEKGDLSGKISIFQTDTTQDIKMPVLILRHALPSE